LTSKIFHYTVICFIYLTITALSQHSNLFTNTKAISLYIASGHFQQLKEKNSDLALVDSIYLFALKQTGNNKSEAFLALTFGTIPYKVVPLHIPIFPVINVPLTSVEDSVFYIKLNQLPKFFLYDSPQDNFGDKDKPAHFFGNAFLYYNIHLFEFTNVFGYFVEVFEETFKVDSKIDFRDMEANKMGAAFASLLHDNPDALPSQIILLNNLSVFRVIL
jgi:hypothetical protein